MYLDCDIVEEMTKNSCYFESSSSCLSKNSIKGYRLIDHAYELVEMDDELYLSDVISNLRKAINYRVNTLFLQLGIDNLDFKNFGKKKKLEKLEELGIVKPLLINKLISIRNGIEYDGNTPPNQVECEELIYIVWYFYKSTDRYCNIEPDSFLIDYESERNFISLDFDFKTHTILKITANLPSNYLSENKHNNEICLYDYKANNESNQNIYFNGKILVGELKNYIDIFSIALCEWGNY